MVTSATPAPPICSNTRSSFREGLTAASDAVGMKRFTLLLTFALMATAPANADTLADQVGAEARRLLAQVSSAQTSATARPGAKPQPLAPTLSTDLRRFGLAASRLSNEIDQRGGPADLRCIFRGMAEETGKQLTAANAAATGAEQARALGRLTHMLKDAVEIAPAVGGNATAASSSRAAAAQCPAAPF